MLHAYHVVEDRLLPLPPGIPIAEAAWIDLETPDKTESAAVEALGLHVPALVEMEQIEISNRLHHDGTRSSMTAVLPGPGAGRDMALMPVTFLLDPRRLVTIRHHAPQPFKTYPRRAGSGTSGLASPEHVFLGLVEEIVAWLADLLEEVGRRLDAIIVPVLETGQHRKGAFLREALRRTAIQSEIMAGIRLGLLGVGRILTFHSTPAEGQQHQRALRQVIEILERDVQALEVHADFLGNRASLTLDATMGMINVRQNDTVRMLSVVAAMFVPPTLVASIYGMNFTGMPGLQTPWGWAVAILAMLGSSLGTWLLLRWKDWL